MRTSIALNRWIDRWNQAIQSTKDELVLNAWNHPPPRNCLRTEVTLNPGPRRKIKGTPVGEQIIELKLLEGRNGEPKEWQLVNSGSACRIRVYYNHLPLTNRRRQKYPDGFGVLQTPRGDLHAIAVEVKDRADDCWYAAVENLVQVQLLRANRAYQGKLLAKVGVAATKGIFGTWGLVLAPEEYYERHPEKVQRSRNLIEKLKTIGRGRITLAILELDTSTLKFCGGYWPR